MQSRHKRLAIILIIVGLIIVYAIFDPTTSALFPQCFFLKLTGWQCPGCGSQRMLHALLQGDIVAAWHYNAFLLAMSPVILFMVWLEIRRFHHPRLYRNFYSLPFIFSVIVLTLAWLIVRNILGI
ncbi:MAG: DUF2752 domain-containing protein [Muribaculaceae bacterium]|jgi:hypothetical protein|nr:DUF2752 domain-containing protein [Muribaculaceae bacterium]MBO7164850.1 DUF2752 domain-containing protein [Muribaculaceae bacterium]MBQ1185306.1 DUF2752 domain-containing protein [Muribaculaceae bacterium]MBQ2400163.1 DUF2752 domain-containing protein [Muribaculaceae bacterium]MBQ2440077.1 DUF2752 domain-containing protein [Muribaculaceae bacterium]